MKRLLKLTGVAFALATTVYFAVYAYHALAGHNLDALLSAKIVLAVIVLTLLYASLIPLTAVAWMWLLRGMRENVSLKKLLPIMAVTQFGKYLPGNIAQHLGRLALVRSCGVGLSTAFFSVIYEMLLVIIVGLHIGALTLLWQPPHALLEWGIMRYRIPLLIGVTVLGATALVTAPTLASIVARWRAQRPDEISQLNRKFGLSLPVTGGCYVLYAVNFILVGTGLWLVASTLATSHAPSPGPLFMISAYACSWVLGFVTPGAPAGLGIREAILSAWLSGSMSAEQIALLVIALRIATTLGDLVNFGLGGVAMARKRAGIPRHK